MLLVNETHQAVSYNISADGMEAESGTIEVNGLVDLPAFNKQTNVAVQFTPVGGGAFQIEIQDTHAGEQVEMAVLAR